MASKVGIPRRRRRYEQQEGYGECGDRCWRSAAPARSRARTATTTATTAVTNRVVMTTVVTQRRREYDYARVIDVEPLVAPHPGYRAAPRMLERDPRGQRSLTTTVRDRNRGVSTVLGAHDRCRARQPDRSRRRPSRRDGGGRRDRRARSVTTRPRRPAQRGYGGPPVREYTRRALRGAPRRAWEERTDGYRVTYVYNGRARVSPSCRIVPATASACASTSAPAE